MFEQRASQLHHETQQEGFNSPQEEYYHDQRPDQHQQDQWQQNPSPPAGNEPLVTSGGGYDALVSPSKFNET